MVVHAFGHRNDRKTICRRNSGRVDVDLVFYLSLYSYVHWLMEAPKSSKIEVDKSLYKYEVLKSAGYVGYVSYWNSATKVTSSDKFSYRSDFVFPRIDRP